jgi:hypothetical protein
VRDVADERPTRAVGDARAGWGSVVRVGLGAACLLVPAWVAITRWSTLIAGHPAYPVLLAVLVLLGVLLLVRRACPRRTGRLRLVGRVVVGLLLVAVLGCTARLRPFAADPVAVAAAATRSAGSPPPPRPLPATRACAPCSSGRPTRTAT